MIFNYQDFKSEVINRSPYYFQKFRSLFPILEDFYVVDNIKALYIRNFSNDKEEELVLFLNDIILLITKEDLHFKFKEIKSKIAKKELIVSHVQGKQTVLTLKFENGEVLIFDNKDDSNSDWHEEYTIDIKEIYKLV